MPTDTWKRGCDCPMPFTVNYGLHFATTVEQRKDSVVIRGRLTNTPTCAACGADLKHVAKPAEPACRVCGCTEFNACVGAFGEGCHWVEKDLCSACAPRVVRQAKYLDRLELGMRPTAKSKKNKKTTRRGRGKQRRKR